MCNKFPVNVLLYENEIRNTIATKMTKTTLYGVN